ncbi:hypothetical protein B0J14DRAFT_256108 [Halenospora varia]|nr:hypothetical protein B0J14DRAFT_256108 [Halenospora varia]
MLSAMKRIIYPKISDYFSLASSFRSTISYFNYGALFLISQHLVISEMLSTVSNLSTHLERRCNLVLNDRNFDIMARNAIILLYTLVVDPEIGCIAMTHIWYSTLIPDEPHCHLQESPSPLIDDFCVKIRSKHNESLQSKTWIFGTRSLKLVLQKKQWDKLPSFLNVPAGLSATNAQEARRGVMLAPQRATLNVVCMIVRLRRVLLS